MDALLARNDAKQWELLIGNLLKRLELPPATRAAAEADYLALANSIAQKLGVLRSDIEIFSQGSMRTQTTIPQRAPAKLFDLDIVVKLNAPWLTQTDPHELFKLFGKALEGNESVTGVPEAKRRCWFLNYPGKDYCFDVTPAVQEPMTLIETVLRVRDPDTHWSPSNPVAFAKWFCDRAELRFKFQQRTVNKAVDARTSIEPLPDEKVGMDDILRRVVQFMKLHRDGMYWFKDPEVKKAQPISVVLVTLAGHSCQKLWVEEQAGRRTFASAIEVALAIVEELPTFIGCVNGRFEVRNPELQYENFADKWNGDQGVRAKQFALWHKQLEQDLDALLHQDEAYVSEDKLRAVFSQAGVDAWKASKPKRSVMDSLLGSAAGHVKTNPTSPTRPGSSGTLG
jgi:hypothetical protein